MDNKIMKETAPTIATTRNNQNRGTPQRAILVLHGNRQTGELFLGRLGTLRHKLKHSKPHSGRIGGQESDSQSSSQVIDNTCLVAPDAPFQYVSCALNSHDGDDDELNSSSNDNNNDDSTLRTWWVLEGDGSACTYAGLEESIDMLHSLWTNNNTNYTFEGILGFSQGARLAYLISYLHIQSSKSLFPGLKYMMLSGGYGNVPLPMNLKIARDFLFQKHNIAGALQPNTTDGYNMVAAIDLPSLHVIGLRDKVILPLYSRDLVLKFHNATVYEHDGGHFMPMKAKDTEIYLGFIAQHSKSSSLASMSQHQTSNLRKYRTPSSTNRTSNGAPNIGVSTKHIKKSSTTPVVPLPKELVAPDEEHAMEQTNECEALEVIYPDEYQQISTVDIDCKTGEKTYSFPIEYKFILANDFDNAKKEMSWPLPSSVALRVKYPANYPDVSAILTLDHTMNSMQFSSNLERQCLQMIREASEKEIGMPCAMSCILAAKEFFENFGDNGGLQPKAPYDETKSSDVDGITSTSNEPICDERLILGIPADSKIIETCDEEGQMIANVILRSSVSSEGFISSEHPQGQPSSSSIVCNNSTSSSRGGAWKYTIGLVGKPSAGKSTFFNAATAFARQQRDGDNLTMTFGASMAPHPFTTIDPNVGFCFVPALPGACPEDSFSSMDEKFAVGSTHGRDSHGRRLIPVSLKDVAGLVPGAYKGRGRGNKFLDDLTDADVLIHVVDSSGTADADGNIMGVEGGTHPLQDLAWVRKELLEWVSTNIEAKWDTVIKKGPNRLAEMFTGYKQSQAFVWGVLFEVEKFMATDDNVKLDHALDRMEKWSGGDLRRLVNAFLGARFPMALALNKSDVASAPQYIRDICDALPVHGAHVGVALSSKREMEFVRNHMEMELQVSLSSPGETATGHSPEGVWNCLQAAMSLRKPILVFPVADMISYDPLPGMTNYATLDASLPSAGFIHCLESSGGSKPTLWNDGKHMYHLPDNSHKITNPRFRQPLRDVLVMKPGSTVEDVFNTLKRLGAIRGDYVRAEGSGNIGEKPRLVRKEEQMNGSNRILKIMTNKKV